MADGSSGGRKVGQTLGREFSQYAARRGRWAFIWSAIVLVLLVAAATVTVLLLRSPHPLNWQEAVVRLGVAIPVYTAVGYAVRVASQNRDAGLRAWVVSIQAYNIDAYCRTLPTEAGELLRYEFGRRVFGEPLEGTAALDGRRTRMLGDPRGVSRLGHPSSASR